MKNKLYISIISILTSMCLLTGCELPQIGGSRPSNEIADNTKDGLIKMELGKGIRVNENNLSESLTNGSFYIIHNHKYYEIKKYDLNYDQTDEVGGVVKPERQLYYTTENEVDIPTLFPGDKLVYYSTDTLLDYVTWERYYDLGYTIGIHNLQKMVSDRYYIDTSNDARIETIIPDSELYDIYNLKVDQVYVNKINDVDINTKIVKDGLITPLVKSQVYDLEVYSGSFYKHFNAVANIHAFRAYELFASPEYTPNREFLYEIQIPDYFVDGYYSPNNAGLFRYVKEPGYSDQTEFNEQLLFPVPDEYYTREEEDKYIAPCQYSTMDELNEIKKRAQTMEEGTLGYYDPEEIVAEDESVEEDFGNMVLKESTKKDIEIWIPDTDKKASIRITSPANESTGDIYIKFLNRQYQAVYDRLTGIYTLDIPVKGERGTLTISGLWKSYEIDLINCSQYNGQDSEIVAETETEITENTKTTEE